MRTPRLLAFTLFTGIAALAPFAHGQMPAQDTVKGAQDHPLLSRFEGSKLVGYGVKEFDEVLLPAGKRVANKDGLSLIHI